jgi:H/ACA ribonucleoprotein complex subunit 4
MHDLADAFALWEENKDGSKLLRLLQPIEHVLSEIKSVVIRDSAVDALCHGAQLAIPGILSISPNLKKGDLVAIYTQKGEAVALAEALITESEIQENTKGYAFQTKRIIMAPNIYPKNWHSKQNKK